MVGRHSMRRTILAALFLAGTSTLTANDWPGWRGPARTGVSQEKGLLTSWPQGGPRLLWKATGVGGGYSTPSVVDGRLFVMGSKENDEYVMAYAVKDGQQLWS